MEIKKRINFDIKLINDTLTMRTSAKGNIGTMWDHNMQTLVFNRPPGLESYDLLLMLRPGAGQWLEQYIGAANEYTLTNAYTQEVALSVAAVFLEGNEFRGGTNEITLYFRRGEQSGAVPVEFESDINALRQNAVTHAEVNPDTTDYDFFNMAGDYLFSLPASSGASGFGVPVFSINGDGDLIMTVDGTSAPNITIDADGYIIYTVGAS